MKTEREIDKASISNANEDDAQMQYLLYRITDIHVSEPEIRAALDASQKAFEQYRSLQVALISATVAGTIASALRAATYSKLTTDRTSALQMYLTDTKPDLI